jgi:hypothetical protein
LLVGAGCGLPGKVRDEIGRLPQAPLTYACGDFEGAARYALRERGTPVVISFESPLEEAMIDGRDFLYTRDGCSAAMKVGERRRQHVPAGTLALVRSPLALRSMERT